MGLNFFLASPDYLVSKQAKLKQFSSLLFRMSCSKQSFGGWVNHEEWVQVQTLSWRAFQGFNFALSAISASNSVRFSCDAMMAVTLEPATVI